MVNHFDWQAHEAAMRAERARVQANALRTMTKRIEQRLNAHHRKLLNQGLMLDEAGWRGFLKKLHRDEQWFIQNYWKEIQEMLTRTIENTPLEKMIEANGGKWPMPKGWEMTDREWLRAQIRNWCRVLITKCAEYGKASPPSPNAPTSPPTPRTAPAEQTRKQIRPQPPQTDA